MRVGSQKLQTKDLRNYGRAEIPILVLVLVSSILLFFSNSELQTPIRGLLTLEMVVLIQLQPTTGL
ncbi:MAG: hypothetical protein QNJ41_09030 [Xenococcaceae cyanobacterium MO_188.B32]|nr:hypothetical protein [Xenococcaceae cyanobacterium MO_188.B32]